jgi:pyrroloquinoline quinone biosynthesis protein E
VYLPKEKPSRGSFVLQLKLTNRCGMNCVHCYNPRDEEALGRELDTSRWSLIVLSYNNYLAKAKLRASVHFIGGEPLLRPDLFDIANVALRTKDARTTLVTNGVEINRHVIDRIKRSFHAVTVNLPCADGEGFESIRRSPLYDLVVSNAKAMVDRGVSVALAVNVMKQNAGSVAEVIPLASSIGACRVSYHRFIGMKKLEDWHPSPEQLSEAVREIRAGVAKHPEVEVTSRDPVLSRMLGLPVKPCIVGHSILNIEPDGKATPCRYIYETVGDATKESIARIVGGEKYRRLGDRRSIRGACQDCAGRSECVGCRALAYHNGDIFGEDPICTRERKGDGQ